LQNNAGNGLTAKSEIIPDQEEYFADEQTLRFLVAYGGLDEANMRQGRAPAGWGWV